MKRNNSIEFFTIELRQQKNTFLCSTMFSKASFGISWTRNLDQHGLQIPSFGLGMLSWNITIFGLQRL